MGGRARKSSAFAVPEWEKTVTLGLYPTAKEYLTALQTPPLVIRDDRVVEMISQMPISTVRVDVTLRYASLRQLGFEWSDRPTETEILQAANDRGLGLCPAEVGAALRLAYPDPKRAILYKHSGDRRVETVAVAMKKLTYRRLIGGRPDYASAVFSLDVDPSYGLVELQRARDWVPNIAHEHDTPVIFMNANAEVAQLLQADAEPAKRWWQIWR
jgi:hypothetical protein